MCNTPSMPNPFGGNLSSSPLSMLALGVGGGVSAGFMDTLDLDTAEGAGMAGALTGLGGHIGHMLGGMEEAKADQAALESRAVAEREELLAKKKREEAARAKSSSASEAQAIARQSVLRSQQQGQPAAMGASTGVQGVPDTVLRLGRTTLGGS